MPFPQYTGKQKPLQLKHFNVGSLPHQPKVGILKTRSRKGFLPAFKVLLKKYAQESSPKRRSTQSRKPTTLRSELFARYKCASLYRASHGIAHPSPLHPGQSLFLRRIRLPGNPPYRNPFLLQPSFFLACPSPQAASRDIPRLVLHHLRTHGIKKFPLPFPNRPKCLHDALRIPRRSTLPPTPPYARRFSSLFRQYPRLVPSPGNDRDPPCLYRHIHLLLLRPHRTHHIRRRR